MARRGLPRRDAALGAHRGCRGEARAPRTARHVVLHRTALLPRVVVQGQTSKGAPRVSGGIPRPPVGPRRPARLLRASVRAPRTRGDRQGHREHFLGNVARHGGRRHRLLVREVERSEPERLSVLHVRGHARALGLAEPLDRPRGARISDRHRDGRSRHRLRARELQPCVPGPVGRPTVRSRAGGCPDDRLAAGSPVGHGLRDPGRHAAVPHAATPRPRPDLGRWKRWRSSWIACRRSSSRSSGPLADVLALA